MANGKGRIAFFGTVSICLCALALLDNYDTVRVDEVIITSDFGHSCNPAEWPEYDINLDVPAKDRWTHIIQDIFGKYGMDPFKSFTDTIKTKYERGPAEIFVSTNDLDNILQGRVSSFSADDLEEMRGIAQTLAALSGQPVEEITRNVVLSQFLYEEANNAGIYKIGALGSVNKACTSAIVNTRDGKVIHSRNMDWPLFDGMPNLRARIRFSRGGSLVFQGNFYVPWIGTITGQRYGAYSIDLHQRDQLSYGHDGDVLACSTCPLKMTDRLAAGYSPDGLAIRHALEQQASFNVVVTSLENVSLVTPCYFDISGLVPGDGAIVARGLVAHKSRRMTDIAGTWYLVQANYDWWQSVGANDGRDTNLARLIEDVGVASLDANTLFGLMRHNGVVQGDTDQTDIMCAAQNKFKSTFYLTSNCSGAQ